MVQIADLMKGPEALEEMDKGLESIRKGFSLCKQQEMQRAFEKETVDSLRKAMKMKWFKTKEIEDIAK